MDIIISILNESWILTMEMAPYLLFGFIAAGFLHVFIPVEIIGKHLGNESISSVIKASIFGVPIPLCSCGVLPVAASIKKSGASRSATLSFLITTPVTGVDSLMATWALMGPIFTAARLGASLVIGFITGSVMSFDFRKNKDSIKIDNIKNTCSDTDCCGNEKPVKKNKFNFFAKAKEILNYSFIELPSSFSGSLLFGLLFAGIISYMLPPELVKQYIGTGILGIIISTIIAIPLYVCATGSIPIAAAMIATGFSPGAALAFLIAGPATNTVAILTVKQILGKKALFAYIAFIFLGALGFGMLLDLFNISLLTASIKHHMKDNDSLFKIICAAVLLAFIIPLYIKEKYIQYFNRINSDEVKSMDKTVILLAPAISCQHCASTIKDALSQLKEIENVKVDVNSKIVSISLKENIDVDKILSVMDEAGYSATLK